MSFDPTNFDPMDTDDNTDGGGRTREAESDVMCPVGNFVFWMKGFTRKRSKGKDQIVFICEAILTEKLERINGKYKVIFEMVTLTANAVWKLRNFCQAIECLEPFNAMSDKDVCKFKFKPFKASVRHSTYNGRTSANIESYFDLSEAEKAAAKNLLCDTQVPCPGYCDQDGDNQQEFSDDDIPF